MKFENFTEAVRQMKGHVMTFQGISIKIQPISSLYE